MDTWVKFQIDYIERQIGREFSIKEKEIVSWFLKLSKTDQAQVIKLEKELQK